MAGEDQDQLATTAKISPQQKVKNCSEEVKAAKASGDKAAEAGALLELADALLMAPDQKDSQTLALDAAKNAENLYKTLGDKGKQAKAAEAIVSAHLSSGDQVEQALAKALDLRTIFQELEDKKSEANLLLQISNIYASKGDEFLDQAEETASDSRKLFVDLGDQDAQLDAMIATSQTHLQKGEAEKAMQIAYEGLGVARRSGAKRTEAHALHNVVSCHLGSLSKDAVELNNASEEDKATLQQALDAGYAEVVETAKEVVARYDVLGDKPGKAKALYALCNTYFFGAEYDLGKAKGNLALPIFMELGDGEGYMNTLLLLAHTHLQRGDPCAAMRKANEARELCDQMYRGGQWAYHVEDLRVYIKTYIHHRDNAKAWEQKPDGIFKTWMVARV